MPVLAWQLYIGKIHKMIIVEDLDLLSLLLDLYTSDKNNCKGSVFSKDCKSFDFKSINLFLQMIVPIKKILSFVTLLKSIIYIYYLDQLFVRKT